MPDVFLSYSREDQATARRFAQVLEQAGFSVWWDQTLKSGDAYDEVTENALRSAKSVVVLWSKSSVASRWVRAEATIADRAGTLVPAMIEECQRPVMFELRQTADLSGWRGDAEEARWQAFIGDLRSRVNGAGSPPVGNTVPVRQRRMRLPLFIFLGIGVAAAGGTAWAVLHHWHGGQTRQPAQAAEASPASRTAPVTLAVLPFADMSSSKDQEYLADGMTEEILNSFAQIRDLRVTGRTSSFYFKARNEDTKTIGEKLGVEYLLEGSVRKEGEQLRITAQLVKASDGFHLSSRTYDRPLKDVFRVQQDIARDVAQVLQVKLGIGELGETTGMTHDLQAYDSYLKGLAYAGNGDYEKTVAAMEQAVAQDPDFALAWVQLLDARQVLSQSHGGGATPEIRAAREKVQSLLPDSVLMLTGQAFASVDDLDYAGAARQFAAARATAVKQMHDTAGINLLEHDEAVFLQGIDAADQALKVYARYQTREPLSTRNEGDVALAYLAAGRYADARQEILRVFARLDEEGRTGPSSQLTGRMIALGLLPEPGMRQLLGRIVDATGSDKEKRLFSLIDRPAGAALLRQPADEQDDLNVFSQLDLAMWNAHFGDAAQTLERFQKMSLYESGRAHWLLPMLWQPLMKDVRALPEFKNLVRKLGLVDYWRKAGWGLHCKPVGDTEFECH